MCDKNFKSLKKEREEDIRKSKDLTCSWRGKINIIKKWHFYQNQSTYSIQSPSKSKHNSSQTLKEQYSTFIWKNKKTQDSQSILYNKKKTSRGITIPDIKLYYRSTVMKTAWDWQKNQWVDNGIERKTAMLIHTPKNM